MNILIGADIVPTASNADLFAAGDANALVGGDLAEILENAAYRIFNLETPLTDHRSPIAKQGPALIAPSASVAGYQALGIDLVTLANNHILDQGAGGLLDTIQALDNAGVRHVGAGNNLKEALAPYVFEFSGKTIGVYACAEHEFSIASDRTPGANPFDPLESPDHVAALKGQCDYVIVLYHGGKEHYRYPSPNLQKVCRKLVEKGADLVICQHSHCVGCEEKYQNGTIVYGQGNFLFDHSENPCWKTGLLVSLDDRFQISYLPLVKDGNRARLADPAESGEILAGFHQRSEEILAPGFVEAQYRSFAEASLDRYLFALQGHKSLVFRVANKLTGNYLRKKQAVFRYGARQRIALRNYIECEAHRELLLQGLRIED